MNQKMRASQVKTINFGPNTASAVFSAFNTWKMANQAYIIPEGLMVMPLALPNNANAGTILTTTLTAATMADLKTAYDAWIAANTGRGIVRSSFWSTVDSVGATQFYGLIEYVSSWSSALNSTQFELYVQYLVNDQND